MSSPPTSYMRPPGALWYPIGYLTLAHADRTVHLAGQGWEVVGRLSLDPASRLWAWMEWHAGLGQYLLLTPFRIVPDGALRHRREPTAWRPVEWEAWPEPLPEALIGPIYREPEPGPEPDPPPLPETDDWPYPGLRLGERVPPVCEREAEARVLRGLRRMEMEPNPGLRTLAYASDIPREFYHLMRRHQQAEDAAEARRRGLPVTAEIGAVRSAWTPSRRDNGDWHYALDWWRQLTAFERQLFRFRAANPPFSWRQIAERVGGSKDTVRGNYLRAVDKLTVIARATPAELIPTEHRA
ncbi:MAG: hypothetical protein AB7K67_01050 [Hyphomicrobiaceae bacterium]